MLEQGPHHQTLALHQDVERRLAELADDLTGLADDLQSGVDVPPAEARRLADRAAATQTSARFLQVIEASAG